MNGLQRSPRTRSILFDSCCLKFFEIVYIAVWWVMSKTEQAKTNQIEHKNINKLYHVTVN